MAYITKEKKAIIIARVKAATPKGWRGDLGMAGARDLSHLLRRAGSVRAPGRVPGLSWLRGARSPLRASCWLLGGRLAQLGGRLSAHH